MNTAQRIQKRYGEDKELMIEQARTSCTMEQKWEEGITAFLFSDSSALTFKTKNIIISTAAH
jgi:hypothetical protein